MSQRRWNGIRGTASNGQRAPAFAGDGASRYRRRRRTLAARRARIDRISWLLACFRKARALPIEVPAQPVSARRINEGEAMACTLSTVVGLCTVDPLAESWPLLPFPILTFPFARFPRGAAHSFSGHPNRLIVGQLQV